MVLERLCADVFYIIFSYMKHSEIFQMSMINRSFYNLIMVRFKSAGIPFIFRDKQDNIILKFNNYEITFSIYGIDRFADKMNIMMHENNVASMIMIYDHDDHDERYSKYNENASHRCYIDKLYISYIKILMQYLNKEYLKDNKKFQCLKKYYRGNKATNKLQFRSDYESIMDLKNSRTIFNINKLLYNNKISKLVYIHKFKHIINKKMAIRHAYELYDVVLDFPCLDAEYYVRADNCFYYYNSATDCECDGGRDDGFSYNKRENPRHSNTKTIKKYRHRYYFIDPDIKVLEGKIAIIKTHPPNALGMRYNLLEKYFIKEVKEFKCNPHRLMQFLWKIKKKNKLYRFNKIMQNLNNDII